MRGRTYLAMGGTSMGIAGSIVDPAFFEHWIGMRVESVDMIEFIRRIEREIYDKSEFAKALKWVKAHCQEGKDWNSPKTKRSRKRLDAEWETSVKMALIARDLMVGNPQLAKMGFGEEAQGHHAVASGFQGQRQWTDHMSNGDFLEAILNRPTQLIDPLRSGIGRK
jgi:L-fucose isomerase